MRWLLERKQQDGAPPLAGMPPAQQQQQPAQQQAPPPLSDCVVCLDAPRTEVLPPCGHLAVCAACTAQPAVRKLCPVCCKHVEIVLTVFHY